MNVTPAIAIDARDTCEQYDSSDLHACVASATATNVSDGSGLSVSHGRRLTRDLRLVVVAVA